MRSKFAAAVVALGASFVLPATAIAGHGLNLLDHEPPAFTASPLALPLAQSGGPTGSTWPASRPATRTPTSTSSRGAARPTPP